MSSWAEKRAQRLLVPWNEDTPDAKGFWKYAYNHYHECIILACQLAKNHESPDVSYEAIFQAVFEKIASPLVYLYDAWCVMPSEKKAKFNPEIAETAEKIRKQAEECYRRLSEGESSES